MEPKGKQLTAKLIELRNAIKRKYRVFKEGSEENDILLEKQYRPIIQELRKTPINSRDIKSEQPTLKDEPMDYTEQSLDYDSPDDEEEAEPFSPDIVSTPTGYESSQIISSPSEPVSTTQFVETYHSPITQEYLNVYFRDSGGNRKTIDYVYGPYFLDGTKLMVGNKNLDFDHEGNVRIGGINYGASEGLYELLFKRLPDRNIYTDDDLKTYRSILIATNAHRDDYKYDGKIKSNRGLKYTRIIQKILPTRGRGMTWKSLKSRDILYWDDPNELVERLEHVAMSAETGNQIHTNEIISIVEELKEAGIIKGNGNTRFKALLK